MNLSTTDLHTIQSVLRQWIAEYGQQDDDPSVFPNGYDVREALEHLNDVPDEDEPPAVPIRAGVDISPLVAALDRLKSNIREVRRG